MNAGINARRLTAICALGLLIALVSEPALAQLAHRPFAVAGGEGGGNPGGLTGWLLAVVSTYGIARDSSQRRRPGSLP